MFTLSSKGIYGLLAIMYLVMNYGNGHLQIRDIAEACGIPRHYLEQLLVMLKKGGIVKSIRGNQGGYLLAKAPDKVKVIDVLSYLEGYLKVIPGERKETTLDFFWKSLQEKIRGELEVTLNELLLRMENQKQRIMFVI